MTPFTPSSALTHVCARVSIKFPSGASGDILPRRSGLNSLDLSQGFDKADHILFENSLVLSGKEHRIVEFLAVGKSTCGQEGNGGDDLNDFHLA
jgi:hypothetical protein